MNRPLKRQVQYHQGMEERKPIPTPPSKVEERKPIPSLTGKEPPNHSEGRKMLEQAFARGSGALEDAPSVPEPIERTEHSVMEGLPPAKAEKIAAMRRELAELQRQL